LDGRGEEGVSSVTDEGDSGLWRDPSGKGVAVYELPIDEVFRRRGRNNGMNDGVPAIEDAEGVGDETRS
jgi:hypothetical protein